MRKLIHFAIIIVVTVMVAGGVHAQFTSSDDAIQYRKSAMFMIAQHFKRMGAVVQGKAEYNQQAFAANASVLKVLATLPREAFLVPGSDKGNTAMSPAVFSSTEDFNHLLREFEAATAKLDEVSQNGKMDAIKEQFGKVAISCQTCHSNFRK